MHTERAKNAVIIILLALNIAVYALNVQRQSMYTLTMNQEVAVTSVLAQNRITLYAPIIKNFRPLKRMAMSPFDFAVLEKLLFDGVDPADITEYTEFDKVVKISPAGRITLYHDRLEFTASPKEGSGDIDATKAKAVCDAFISRLCGLAGIQMVFSGAGSLSEGGALTISYTGCYDGVTIASNTLEIVFSAAGIIRLKCTLAVPEGLSGTALAIYSADEALLALSRLLQKTDEHDYAFRITDMEIVYCLTEKTGGESFAAPFYMFSVKESSGVSEDTRFYYINAYTNTLWEP